MPKAKGKSRFWKVFHPALTHLFPLCGGYVLGLELLCGLDRQQRASVIVSDHFVCMLCHCGSIPVGRARPRDPPSVTFHAEL
jgi:hypothetical protein